MRKRAGRSSDKLLSFALCRKGGGRLALHPRPMYSILGQYTVEREDSAIAIGALSGLQMLILPDLQMLVLRYGYIALFILLTAEEAGIPLPVPGDLVIAYAGFLSFQGHLNWAAVFFVCLAAVALGSFILYSISLRWGHPLIERYGRYLRLTPERISRAEDFFRHRGGLAIVVGRLTPGLRTATSAVSGLFEVPVWIFVPSTLLASAFWVAAFLALGSLGETVFDELRAYLQPQWPFLIAVIVIALVGLLLWRYRTTCRNNGSNH